MDDKKLIEKFCERCETERFVKLVRNITQDGKSQVYWYCIFGKHPTLKQGMLIPHDQVKAMGYDHNDLPVINNYSGQVLCVVCGSPFTQLNHWAPRYLFGDEECERWPKDYLCERHHKIWHEKMTPSMSKVRGNA